MPSHLSRKQDSFSTLYSREPTKSRGSLTTALAPVTCGPTCPPPQRHLLGMKSQRERGEDIVRAGGCPADRSEDSSLSVQGPDEGGTSNSS